MEDLEMANHIEVRFSQFFDEFEEPYSDIREEVEIMWNGVKVLGRHGISLPKLEEVLDIIVRKIKLAEFLCNPDNLQFAQGYSAIIHFLMKQGLDKVEVRDLFTWCSIEDMEGPSEPEDVFDKMDQAATEISQQE